MLCRLYLLYDVVALRRALVVVDLPVVMPFCPRLPNDSVPCCLLPDDPFTERDALLNIACATLPFVILDLVLLPVSHCWEFVHYLRSRDI